MGFSGHYRAEVESCLSAVTPITSRVMFGGVAIYSEGLLFAVIDDDRLYFKANDATKDRFEERGQGPLFYDPAKPPMAYWELPSGIIDEPEELADWIAVAVQVAREKAASKPKRRKRKP